MVPARFMGGDLFRAELDVAAGEAITYHACAVDMAGNKACSKDVTFIAAGGQGTGGSTGSTSSSAGGGASSSSSGGGGGSGGGCGCAVPGSDGSESAPGMLGLALAALVWARRRAAGLVKSARATSVGPGGPG
jgi:MYXO-CTERM domain-containing protein